MANWVNQRLRVFGSKADLEKFYKKTSTKESHFDLWHIHELVDGFECNSRDFERSDQIEIQDIAQKDFPKKINSKLQGKQYSQIETAWGWRPELYLKLSQLFPNLILEVYYVEEGQKTQNKHSFIIDALKVNTNILKYVPTNYIKKKMNLMKLFETIKDLDNPSDKISTLINVIGTKTKYLNNFNYVKNLINKNHLDLENILTNIEYFKLNKNSLLFLSKQIK